MDTTASSKAALRATCKERRDSLNPAYRLRADAAITQRVCALAAFREAELVCSYLSFGTEVETRALIRTAWKARKVVALPYCVPGSRTMRWFEVASFEGLVRSRLGMLQPDPLTATEVDPFACARALALVPALTFDRKGWRLGYGGGFYDTFLATFAGVSAGLCHDAMLHKNLAAACALEPHDLPVQVVVTEEHAFLHNQDAAR